MHALSSSRGAGVQMRRRSQMMNSLFYPLEAWRDEGELEACLSTSPQKKSVQAICRHLKYSCVLLLQWFHLAIGTNRRNSAMRLFSRILRGFKGPREVPAWGSSHHPGPAYANYESWEPWGERPLDSKWVSRKGSGETVYHQKWGPWIWRDSTWLQTENLQQWLKQKRS